MSHLWTKEETKSLITRIEMLPELWNVSLNDYRNRVKKCNTLETLAEEFKTTPSEVNRKLHNLRTQLNNELRKIKSKKSGQGSDENYRSTWEFFESLKFMVPTEKVNETQSNLELTDEFRAHISNQDVQTQDSAKVKKRKKEDEILEAALIKMNKPDDDAQIFGNFVATSIRNLRSDDRKRLLKRKIQRVILEVEDLENLDYHASSSSSVVEMSLQSPNTPMPNTEWLSSETHDRDVRDLAFEDL